MSGRTGTRLVWVPENATYLFEHAPPGLEILPIPTDFASDPRLGEVEFIVIGMQEDLVASYPAMTSLKVIQTTTIGLDRHIADTPPGVELCSCRGAADTAGSEWILAAILAGEKNFPAYVTEQLAGGWRPRPGRVLANETVTILGSGSIGRVVAERLAPFGCTVVEIARRPRPGVRTLDALPSVLPETDVLVVLLPLTPETTGMIDGAFLDSLRPGALVVNAARGAIVVTHDLLAAVRSGQVRAVLDVTDPEPLPSDHPLRAEPGLFITPHVAGITPLGQARSYPFVAEQLARFARDEALENVATDGY